MLQPLVVGSRHVGREVAPSARVNKHNWEGLMESSECWLRGRRGEKKVEQGRGESKGIENRKGIRSMEECVRKGGHEVEGMELCKWQVRRREVNEEKGRRRQQR